MMKRRLNNSKAGFTLIEIMVVTGIFVPAMVILMGSIIDVMKASEVAEMRIAATSFNKNVLETLRVLNLERNDLLTYNINDPVAPFIPGVPGGTVQIFILDAGGTPFSLPVADPLVVADPPDPLEIFVVTTAPKPGVGFDYKFRSTTQLKWF